MSYSGPDDYLEKKVRRIIEPMLIQAAIDQPKEPFIYMIEWLQDLQGKKSFTKNMELEELINLRKEVANYKNLSKNEDLELIASSPQDVNKLLIKQSDQEDEEKDKVDKLFEEGTKKIKDKTQRSSVSAEVYGLFNKKENFIAKVVPKSNEQRHRIITRVNNSFMFNSLEDKDLRTVIDAMEEKKFNKGDNVITQGENGDVLYLVDQGTLDCLKIFVL